MECTHPGRCTLESGKMIERVTAWREISAHAISREVEADRITSIYPKDAGLLRQLQELIAAEALCCAFLEFTIQEEADHTSVQLTFPQEARPLIEAVIPAPVDPSGDNSFR